MNINIKLFLKNLSFLYLVTIVPITLFYFISIIPGASVINNLGISPRSFNFIELFSICFSWLLHGSWQHYTSNIVALIILIIPLQFATKKTYFTLFELILISGFFTWLLGSNNSIHIGASGLIYALIGLYVGILYFNRASKYAFFLTFLIFVFFSGYITSILSGFVPQDGISVAAHLGGFIGGIVVSYFNK